MFLSRFENDAHSTLPDASDDHILTDPRWRRIDRRCCDDRSNPFPLLSSFYSFACIVVVAE
jgi:hypothetical protein